MQRTVLRVDISCAKCKKKLLKAVSVVPGVDKVEIDEVKGTVTVTGNADPYEVIVRTKRTGNYVEVVSIGPPPPPPPSSSKQQQPKGPDDKKSGGGDGKKDGDQKKTDEKKKDRHDFGETAQGWPMIHDPYSLPQHHQIVVVPMTQSCEQYYVDHNSSSSCCIM